VQEVTSAFDWQKASGDADIWPQEVVTFSEFLSKPLNLFIALKERITNGTGNTPFMDQG
jgi:hypothetical protein